MPYPVRLYWDGRQGIAKLHGSMTLLTAAPNLHGEPVHRIDYVPGVVAIVQERSIDRERDLEPAEVEKVMLYLAKICQA